MALLFAIIDSYEVQEGKGLPIGNLTSQHFANFFLAHVDHFVKSQSNFGYWVRYMDDMVLFSANKADLQNAHEKIRDYLSTVLKLSLKLEESAPMQAGLPFLGFLVKPNGIYLADKSKRRFVRKIREVYADYSRGCISQGLFGSITLSLCAATYCAKARQFRNRVLQCLQG